MLKWTHLLAGDNEEMGEFLHYSKSHKENYSIEKRRFQPIHGTLTVRGIIAFP